MDVKFGQILSHNDITRASVTRNIAALLTDGISVEDLLVDIRDGFAVAGVEAVVTINVADDPAPATAVSSRT
jgi:hypothetical protein